MELYDTKLPKSHVVNMWLFVASQRMARKQLLAKRIIMKLLNRLVKQRYGVMDYSGLLLKRKYEG